MGGATCNDGVFAPWDGGDFRGLQLASRTRTGDEDKPSSDAQGRLWSEARRGVKCVVECGEV